MTLILSGSDGVSDIDGSASTPAIRGTDANTGIFFPAADTIAFAEGGAEAMRIDSSGNVGVGTTSPSTYGKFVTYSSGGYAAIDTNGQIFSYQLLDVASAGGRLTGGSSQGLLGTINIEQTTTGAKGGYIRFDTCASGSNTPTERMRIDSSGNVGIGTSSPLVTAANRGNVTVNGSTSSIVVVGSGGTARGWLYGASDQAVVASGTGLPLVFQTDNGTERARITSGGEFCINIGSATAGARLAIKGSGSTSATYNIYSTNSANGIVFATEDGGTIYTGTLAGSPYNNTTASAANMFVTSGGVLQRSTSSLKYKTNVQNAVHGLTEVLKLRAVTYEGKADSDAGKTFGGLIAEEVHAAGLSEFVAYNEDGEPDALHYGHMVSLAFKAIQELKAELDTVKAELAALKGQ